MTRQWGECAQIQHIFKSYNEQEGNREGGKGIGGETLSDHQDSLETMVRDSNITPADGIWSMVGIPERHNLRLLSSIQH